MKIMQQPTKLMKLLMVTECIVYMFRAVTL